NFRTRHFFLAVAHSDVARPIAYVLAVLVLRCAKENHRVPALTPANVVVPKDLHEVARLRLGKIGKIAAEPELVKQSRRAGSVRIPASPHAFAVALLANDQLI